MQNKNGFSKILVVSVIILIVFAVASFYFLSPRRKENNLNDLNNSNSYNYSSENKNNSNNQNTATFYDTHFPADVSSCGTNNEIFSVPPIPLSSISYIEPLGHVNPPGHVFPINHLYFYLPLDSQRTAIKTDVSSPGNVNVFKIERFQYYTDSSYKTLLREDYTLSFTPCSNISGFFYHLTSLSDKLLNSFTPPFDYCTNLTAGDEIFESCGKYVDVKINAGEKIGTAGGQQEGSQALDWVLEDFRSILDYANNSRFSQTTGQDYSRYIVCPLDYFTSNLHNSLYGFLGGYPIDNPFTEISNRTTSPLCGTTMQDIPGTAQGNWFAKDASSSMFSEDPNLALLHDDINTSIAVFSVGTTMSSSGLNSGAYYFTPSNSGSVNIDFNNIQSDGKIYCYKAIQKLYSNVNSEPASFVIILQLLSQNELKIEHLNINSCGSGPWNFTQAAQTYYR